MKNAEVLSIDLGSAYTKVAIRTGWGTSSTFVNDRNALPGDVQFCIPTVATRIRKNGSDQWIAGFPAAAMRPGSDVLILENWKAGLLGFPSILPSELCRLAATKFFEQLRESLELTDYWEGVENIPVRVSVPALGDRRAVERVVTGVLKDSGWNVASGRATVYEPESNALGVLTRGVNATVVPPSLDFQRPLGRTPYLQEMLEPGLRRAFEKWETGEPYGVLVVDVGAFTTDFGYAVFDTSLWDDNWKAPKIEQASYPTGVRDLDAAVKELLSPRVREVLETSSTSDWEARKAQLYGGEEVAFRDPKGGVLYVGSTSEKTKVKHEILSFANNIAALQKKFESSHDLEHIGAAILTGGGIMIDAVRDALAKAFKGGTTIRIHDLMDPQEPYKSLGKAGAPPHPADVAARLNLNHQLVRGGSAIGGCSVFFE